MRACAAWHPRRGAIFTSHRIGLPGNSLLPERFGGQQLRQPRPVPVLLAVTCETKTTSALRH
jgi:hypothetical protein